MPHIKVVTDSACDLPESLLSQLEVSVVPHALRWSGDVAPVLDLTPTQVADRMRAMPSDWPISEAPDMEELTRLYRELRDSCDGILSVHVSSKISDAYANAVSAREVFGPMGQGGPFPIAAIDSLQASMSMGWMVLALAQMAADGADLTRLASRATRLTEHCHFAFFTERAQGLQRAGRGVRNIGENISNMHPLFHLDEGQVVVYEKTRTRSKARDALYNFVEDFPKIGELAVVHTGAHFDLEHLMTRIGAIYPRERVLILQAGPATAAWLGPDALGVAAIEAEEYM